MAEDVLGLLESYGIRCHVQGRFAVQTQRGGVRDGKTNVFKEITYVYSFSACQGGSVGLRFGG